MLLAPTLVDTSHPTPPPKGGTYQGLYKHTYIRTVKDSANQEFRDIACSFPEGMTIPNDKCKVAAMLRPFALSCREPTAQTCDDEHL